MPTWQIAIMLKPFLLLLMFAPGAVTVAWVRRYMPQSRLKTALLISWRV